MRELLLVFTRLSRVLTAARSRGTWMTIFVLFALLVLGPFIVPVWLFIKAPLFVLAVGAPVALWIADLRPAAIALAIGILVAVPVVRILRGENEDVPAPPG